MKTYEVKMGRGVQRWQSPYDYIVPQPRGRGLCGASCSVEEALDRPIASPALEDLAKDARRIAIVVPDVTRGWCRAPEMSAAGRKRQWGNRSSRKPRRGRSHRRYYCSSSRGAADRYRRQA